MDLVANINFFSKVTVDDDGKMHFVAGNSTAGSYVDLRAEMDTLLVFNTCQHPMDPDPRYNPKPMRIAVWKSDPPAADDPCRTACPENARAFISHRSPFSFLVSMPLETLMSTLIYTESRLRPEDAVYDHTVLSGEAWMQEIAAGQTFRIVDLEGNQAVDTLFYNALDRTDRYSAQDTIREQGSIYLTAGTKLISSEGNVLLTIVADTCGRHDTLGGACSAESNQVRYAIEKKHMHNCRDSFLLAAAKSAHGYAKRDITHNINFFMNVPVTPEGGLTFADGVSDKGRYVEMRAEMDVIALISNCPQLNNPCNAYNPTPVRLLIWD